MPPLNLELHNPEDDSWKTVGKLDFKDGEGSISDNTTEGRDIYTFGVDPVENKGYIKKSSFGVDSETTDRAKRVISSEGFEAIASLAVGESHELTVKTDISARPRRIRFTYTDKTE